MAHSLQPAGSVANSTGSLIISHVKHLRDVGFLVSEYCLKLLPEKWPQDKNGRAVGFLAQATIELLHEESWESYKLQALSPLARFVESQSISESVMRGILPQKALEPVVREANESFCHDPVLKEIVLRKNLEPEDLEISKDDKPPDIYTQCGFLLQLCRHSYRKTAEDLLVKECFGEQRRSVIYIVLKNYLSELILLGHSRIDIERKVRSLFFEKAPKAINRNTLRFLFRKFSHEKQNFEVFGKADKKLLEALGKLIPLQVVEGRSIPRKVSKKFPKTKKEAYFRLRNRSYDHYSAVQFAGTFLGLGEAMLMLFPGEEMGQLPQKLIARRQNSSDYIASHTHPAISRRILSHSANSAARHMERVRDLVTSEDRSTEDIVGSSFVSATMMAGLGDKSTAPEVKLLTLWAAFEALLPNVPDGATNRISHFLEYIVPAVTLSYGRDCFVEFSRELQRLHGAQYKDYLEGLPTGETVLADRLAAVVISGSDQQKKELCNIVSSNPLALFRLMEMEKKFSDPHSFETTITQHRKRVEWQVQRIYRERNTVMHNGHTSPAIDRLLSNTYYYYLLTYANIETVAKSYGKLSIPQSLSAIRKLTQSDHAKLTRARRLCESNSLEAQVLLRQLISGHFHIEA